MRLIKSHPIITNKNYSVFQKIYNKNTAIFSKITISVFRDSDSPNIYTDEIFKKLSIITT